jgi:phosphoglycolate phosphatase-like HAD superfamily hydrolase
MRYIVFDFDGVIGDTRQILLDFFDQSNAVKTLMREKGFDNPEEYLIYAQLNKKNTQELVAHDGAELVNYIHSKGTLPIYSEMTAILKELATDSRMAIVSSNSKALIEQSLGELVTVFDTIFGFEDSRDKLQKTQALEQFWNITPVQVYFLTDTVGDLLELQEHLPAKNLIGCGWGLHGHQLLSSVLAEEQIIDHPSQIVAKINSN